MIKMWQQILLILQFQFLLVFLRTTEHIDNIINYNINIDNQGPQAPLSSKFC